MLSYATFLLYYYADSTMKTVYYLTPSSFCFGVKRSIDQLNDIIKKHPGAKIFCIHALVHNPKVTKEFEKKGIVFVEEIEEVKDASAIIVFSAHGINRKTIDEAKKKYAAVYNLECPFVTKIYKEVDIYLEKWIRKFVYIGKEHHQEGGNVIADIRNKWAEVFVYEQKNSIEDIPYDKEESFAVLSQTTLNFAYVEKLLQEIQRAFLGAHIPMLSDVCKATYERQTVILQHLDKIDAFVVIWGKESNNTKELYTLWVENGKKSFFGESLEDILAYGEDEILAYKHIAITWWASTPVEDIRIVFDYYKNKGYEPKILTLQ